MGLLSAGSLQSDAVALGRARSTGGTGPLISAVCTAGCDLPASPLSPPSLHRARPRPCPAGRPESLRGGTWARRRSPGVQGTLERFLFAEERRPSCLCALSNSKKPLNQALLDAVLGSGVEFYWRHRGRFSSCLVPMGAALTGLCVRSRSPGHGQAARCSPPRSELQGPRQVLGQRRDDLSHE